MFTEQSGDNTHNAVKSIKEVEYMQINRLFEIVYMLMNKKAATARELSDHFEVSQRTIYRDIEILNEAGIPIYTNKGKGGGISILDNFLLNKTVFSEQEQNEILFAMQSFRAVKYVNADTVLTKLSAIFNKSKDIVNWVEVDFSDWTYYGKEKFNAVKSAVLNRKCISFDYYGANGEQTHRTAFPMQLWFKHKAWYIKAFCLKRRDFRLFKISRMNSIETTEDNYGISELFKPDAPELSERFASNQYEINAKPAQLRAKFNEFDKSSEAFDEADEIYEILETAETAGAGTAESSEPPESPSSSFSSSSSSSKKKLKNSVALKLVINASQAHRVYDEFDETNVERDENGNFIVRAMYPEDEWLYGYILSFNYNIEVLEPLYFRDKIIDKLQKTLIKYL